MEVVGRPQCLPTTAACVYLFFFYHQDVPTISYIFACPTQLILPFLTHETKSEGPYSPKFHVSFYSVCIFGFGWSIYFSEDFPFLCIPISFLFLCKVPLLNTGGRTFLVWIPFVSSFILLPFSLFSVTITMTKYLKFVTFSELYPPLLEILQPWFSWISYTYFVLFSFILSPVLVAAFSDFIFKYWSNNFNLYLR